MTQLIHYKRAYRALGRAYDCFRNIPPEDRDVETLQAIAEAAGHVARKIKYLQQRRKRATRNPKRRK